jgi:hypothetical protein
VTAPNEHEDDALAAGESLVRDVAARMGLGILPTDYMAQIVTCTLEELFPHPDAYPDPTEWVKIAEALRRSR